MLNTPERTLPEDVVLEWNAIRSALCDLHCIWRLYSELYGNEKHRALIDETVPGVFWLIHKALRHELLMGLGRLLDLAETPIKKVVLPNLSFEYLLQIVDPHCPPAFNLKLRTMLDDTKAH